MSNHESLLHTKHKNFTIIYQIDIGADTFVLGRRDSETFGFEFVTWQVCGDTFYFGHYITSYKKALLDLFERAERNIIEKKYIYKLEEDEEDA